MTVDRRIEDPGDQFPIGMRVLAVDDDPTCLKLLETLLRRCQYHVTTTCQAKTALNMLREKKNEFDLVISDVHMPDMDGFKLLELVGLEMDLPVIMLSANSDPRLVMKGISHGACDYLVKPVRTEELKNVWQHVIRRKKFDANRKKSSSGNQDAANGGGEGDPGSAGTGNLDQFAKGTKKRKDQNEDDDDENGDDDDEDPSSQKKPRVVWSVELHRKFVAAVNHLGIDKAVPKKILDSMNVEKLTRENVASHLQKYRLYLKRISCVANQQANMVAAFGSTDSSYLRMSSMNAHGSFNPLAMSVPFQNQPFRSFQPGGMIGRLNSPANLGLRLPSSGGMVQLSHAHNPTDSNDQIKFHEQNMLHGVSIPFELDQHHHHHHHNKGASHVGELSAAIDESDVFPLSAGFADSKIPPPPPNGFSIASNVLMMGHCQDPQGGRDFANQSLKSDFCSTSYSWSSPVSSSGFQSSSCPLTDRFKQAALPSNLRESRIGVNHFDGSSMSSVPVQSHTTIADTQCQASGIGNDSFIQPWDHNKHDSTYHPNPNILSGTVNPLMPVNGGALDNSLDFNSMGQPNYGDPSMVRYGEVEKSTMEAKLKQDYVMPYQQRPQGSYIINNFGSLGDVVSGTMK